MKFIEKIFRQPTCPWWFLFTFDNSLRRLYQDPEKILTPYLRPGNRVLDLGCGMGYFSIPAAVLVGEEGMVFAVDLQQRMLDGLKRRAEKYHVESRILCHKASQDRIGVGDKVDFALAFWMVHEVHDRESFIAQIWELLGPGGKLMIAEPYFHVSKQDFLRTFRILDQTGFTMIDEPRIGFSRTILAERE